MLSLKINIITSAVIGGSYAISGQKAKNKMNIPRHLRYMGVRTAATVSTKPGSFINTMPKRILTRIRL